MKIALFVLSMLVTAFALHSYADTPAAATTANLATAAASVPAPALPAITAPSPASPITGGLIACILSCVVCLNIALTAVQKIFASLGKSEPSILVTLSKVVLSVATWSAGNPDLSKTTPPKT